MLMQVMQMDPRFMDVFKEMTGVDLGAMQENRAKQEENTEMRDQEQFEKREAEAAQRRKAEEEAKLPNEAKIALQKAKDAESKKLEGNEYYKKKDFAKALELYSAAIELNPKELLYYTNVAAVYIEQKNFEQAIAQCDTAIAIAKDGAYDFVKLAKVIARKASAYEKNGQFQTALDTYAEALLENNDP